MATAAPELYEELSDSKLVIFKGDLNYRKLVGDLDWPVQTSLSKALRGFRPAPLVALRTLVRGKGILAKRLNSDNPNSILRYYKYRFYCRKLKLWWGCERARRKRLQRTTRGGCRSANGRWCSFATRSEDED